MPRQILQRPERENIDEDLTASAEIQLRERERLERATA